MNGRRYIFALLTGIVSMLAWAAPSAGDDASVQEYQLKAAFIYKFAQFIDWPAGAFSAADDPIIVATVGDDPFHGDLDRFMDGKKTGDRPMIVKHFASARDIDRCHILFVAASQVQQMPQIMDKLSGKPVVTIGDTDDFCRAGGIIQFLLEDERIRFEVNTTAADHGGVKISSRLLKLAKIYEP